MSDERDYAAEAEAARQAADVARYGAERVNEPNLYEPSIPWTTSMERMKRKIDPVNHIVNGLLVPGSTLLWGAPKAGKSTIALDMALGVANGGTSLSQLNCREGDVLYVSNETSEGVYQEVVGAIGGGDTDRLVTMLMEDEPPIGGALHSLADQWAKTVREPRLVIIDTLDSLDDVDPYNSDIKKAQQALTSAWNNWAIEHDVCAVLVNHDSKAKPEKGGDWTRTLSGTRGYGAGASTLIYHEVAPGGSTGTLHVTGRSLPSVDLPIQRFTTSRVWMLSDITEEQRHYGTVRLDVLAAVRESENGMTTAEVLAKFPTVPHSTIRTHLQRLTEHGDLVQPVRGKYLVSGRLRLVTPE